jgi:hypothetical protein
MSIFYFSKVRHFDNLELVSGTIDTSLIIDRAYFQMALQHPLNAFETDIEALILVDRIHRKPCGLALCSLEQPGRSLMFPLFRTGELSLQDNSPSHINLSCCPCQAKKVISLRSRDPEQISTWIWKLESIFGKSATVSPYLPTPTNITPPSSSPPSSSNRDSFGLGISMGVTRSTSSLDNNLLDHQAAQVSEAYPSPPSERISLSDSPKIQHDLPSSPSLTDQLKDYLVDDESLEDTKPDIDQEKLQQAREVRKKIEMELLEKEKIRDEQRRLNRQLEEEIVTMINPAQKPHIGFEPDKQPLLSNSSSDSSLSSTESQQIDRLREVLRKPREEGGLGDSVTDNSNNRNAMLPSQPPLFPLPYLSPISEDRKSIQTLISDRSSIQESIFISNSRNDLEDVELADQLIVTPDFGNRDLDLSLTPTIPQANFGQDAPSSPVYSSDDYEDNSTFSSPDASYSSSEKNVKEQHSLTKKPSLAGLVSNRLKNISSKFKSRAKPAPEFEIIDPNNVPQFLQTPKEALELPMERIVESANEEDQEESKVANATFLGGEQMKKDVNPAMNIVDSPEPHTPELDLAPERATFNVVKRKSVISDPLGTAVCTESNNSTVQSSSSFSNISVRSLRSKYSASSSSSSLSSLRYRVPEDKEVSVPALPSLPQSILKGSGSGVVIFRGMARISQWKADKWVAITDRDVYIEVNVGGEGGCVSGSSKMDGVPEMEVWLLPNHEVRKSTVHDVQIKQTNHTTMFRLKDGDMAERFLGAVEAARIDVKNQPLLYAKKIDSKRPGPPSMNSTNSSLGSIQSALADVERAREQLLNPKAPASPVVYLPPILSGKSAVRSDNGCCGVIPEEAAAVVPVAVRQTAARLLLLNNLRCRLLERDPLGEWTKTSDLARLSVFSVPGTSMKSLMVRRIEDQGEPLLYEEALPVLAFSRIGKVGVGISYEVAEDEERDLRYVIQMKAEKEAVYIYDLLKQDATTN